MKDLWCVYGWGADIISNNIVSLLFEMSCIIRQSFAFSLEKKVYPEYIVYLYNYNYYYHCYKNIVRQKFISALLG